MSFDKSYELQRLGLHSSAQDVMCQIWRKLDRLEGKTAVRRDQKCDVSVVLNGENQTMCLRWRMVAILEFSNLRILGAAASMEFTLHVHVAY